MANKTAMTSITLAELADAVKFCVKTGQNCYIEGPAGVGKTELISQIAASLNAKLFTTRLAQVEPADLVGFPMPEKVGNDYVMTFSRPNNIPPNDDSDQIYIWFLDEMNRANKQAVNAVMQATDSSKKIGTHKLPKRMVVIGAGNPANDEAYDTAQLDQAMSNRYVHYKVHYDAKTLVDYAKAQKWHPNVISFIQVTGNKLFGATYDGSSPVCTPRSLEAMSNLEHAKLMDNKFQHAITAQGAFGAELGAAYHSHCYELQPVSWKELGTKEGRARLGRLTNPENIRVDLLSFTNDDIREHFHKAGTMSDKEFDLLASYLVDIPADLAAALANQLQKDPAIATVFASLFQSRGAKIVEHLGKAIK